MTAAKHARPHLTTHNRDRGHSAVAGAAYRLGLKLKDERTGEVHDFRRRKLGEEIVRAVTVAPSGAPPWATDPQEMWNRVEASEKRKDSQVARDYRIPVPFGLTDEQAGDLAEELARYISDTLVVPVSVGLHRDADRDALGLLKPPEKQGYHAHLYFPNRPLDFDQVGHAGGKGSATGFGLKLSMLSDKRQCAVWVEDLNRKWAELSNVYLAAAEKAPVIDHRSYARQGIDLSPQPKLGVSAAAMERRGLTTARGDVLREALVMSEVQRRVQDATRTAVQAGRDVRVARIADSVERTVSAAQGRAGVRVDRAIPVAVASRLVLPRGQRMVRTSSVQRDTLAQKVAAAGPKPTNAAEQQAVERAVQLVTILEGFLQTAAAKMKEHLALVEKQQQADSAALDLVYRIDQSRRARAAAERTAHDLTRLHPIRVRLANAGLPVSDPRAATLDLASRHDGHVQETKRALGRLRAEAAEASRKARVAGARLARRKARLTEAVVNLASENSQALQQLLTFLPPESAQLVRDAMQAAGADDVDRAVASPNLPLAAVPPVLSRRVPGHV